MNYSSLKKAIDKQNTGKLRATIANAIIAGSVGKKEVMGLIKLIEASSKHDGFFTRTTRYKIISDKKQWNKDYLEDISASVVCGDVSREFLIHMVEVSQYTRRYKYIGVSVTVLVLIVIAIIVISCIVSSHKETPDENNQIALRVVPDLSSVSISEFDLPIGDKVIVLYDSRKISFV